MNELYMYIFLTVIFSVILGFKLTLGLMMSRFGQNSWAKLLIVSSTATVVFIAAAIKGLLSHTGGV